MFARYYELVHAVRSPRWPLGEGEDRPLPIVRSALRGRAAVAASEPGHA
jgi:hypothetical protein